MPPGLHREPMTQMRYRAARTGTVRITQPRTIDRGIVPRGEGNLDEKRQCLCSCRLA
jgi:hypothetical protein